jgi:hypothetical protein
MSKKQDVKKPTTTVTTTDAPQAATVPSDILAQLRNAPSLDDAVKILAPDAKPKAKPDTMYEVVEPMPNALPQKRGLAVVVYATAARLTGAFKVADIESALPDRKSVRYWVRALAKSGHFREQAQAN